EIIFSLPNGLQGYLLVDNQGHRIDAGPPDIVGDEQKASGTTQVVNGISCMSCHRDGIKPFKDELRGGSPIAGGARQKLGRLVPSEGGGARLLADDEAQSAGALEGVTGPFLAPIGGDAPAEPIASTARLYQRDLDPEQMAAELGLEDVAALQAAL